MEEPADERGMYDTSKASKFQFKSTSKKRSRHQEKDGDTENDHRRPSSKCHRSDDDGEARRRHRRKHKHRSRHDRTFTRSGDYDDPDHRYRESLYDGLDGERSGSRGFDPGAAFRESLFDAMADDEGADYWEGVYGQPVHIYPNTKSGPDGKLERMSDEEYAEYVRTKMWEKSHQHILEERAARERARRIKKEQQQDLEGEASKEEAERERVLRQMEESLMRGEQRKKAKELEAAWCRYLRRWEDLKNMKATAAVDNHIRELIPWPVASGKASHVEKNDIERFLRSSGAWKDDATAVLKVERVRWHPDKMQQRFGQHIDSDTMKIVTAVFQVIDRLWSEHRGRRS